MTQGLAPLISSQRFIDESRVAEKAARFDVFIVRVADVMLRGKPYRILIDGHHNLAAARHAGVEPVWRGPTSKWRRIQARTRPAVFEAFLINNLTDSDWYFVDTGEVVVDLLPLASEETP
ncbi:hypothetical protein [Trinickia dinghuensis]|uniref:ParB/Sulfiredoxin domain-containing protein n=1 Tax=Trinickia dinghuensis TaxID=2291023 RepID=A0A3D8K2X3_9BURK|nr:hypothetical protein [Trinickia dinghuensis]RDU99204.1 hypothetical protein DWV00_08750 [Trinickia dinghuensis]